jgi:hypothetical protein
VLVEDDCDKICDGGWKERPYAWNPVGRVFIEGERKRKGIGYRIVKIYRYEETLERINLGYNLRIHYSPPKTCRDREAERRSDGRTRDTDDLLS